MCRQYCPALSSGVWAVSWHIPSGVMSRPSSTCQQTRLPCCLECPSVAKIVEVQLTCAAQGDLVSCQVRRYVMEDRFCAIRAAIGTAQARDVVVIAGKGNQDYQEHGDGQGGVIKVRAVL